ncbi:MAG TPA: carboxypeptidase regulatory-like domain-containing protein, partial [Blastocatellia bacterium]|nr:carboxypeptidase regulatory-like domain-containing protein [Blastocatellia bacterium]
MIRTIHLLLLLAVSIALSCTTAFAQDFRATITGRVTDASKAGIPNAQVQVKNLGTNEVTTITTDGEGNYKVPFLRPGPYSVTIEASGFKKSTRDQIELVISQVATLDFALETGNISEQITVQGEAQLLESATADRGGVIDRQQVVELPLNARNPFMLGVLTAGVNFNGASIWQRPFDNGAIAEWTINGSQSRGNEFLLDGAPNNAQAGGNNIAYVPPVDSVQDFKIMTNTYDAQYGKTTGGIINVNLKSGTNTLHGSVYEFMRRGWLDATDFRLKAKGADKAAHYLDQYGFMLEGPVRIPKVYNGKDKTFFMVNYEGYREGVPQPLTLSVPAPEMLNGNFSSLRDSAGKVIQIYNGGSTRPNPTFNASNPEGPGNLRYLRDPFKCNAAGQPLPVDAVTGLQGDGQACNMIPTSLLNPVAQNILRYYLQPNRNDPTAGYSRNNLFVSPNLAVDDFYNLAIKIDRQFNEKHHMFVRYARNDRTEIRNVNGIFNAPGQDGQHPLKRVNDAFVVDHVATFTPNFIFNIRASFGRFVEGSRGDANLGFDLTSLGFPAALVSQIPQTPGFGRYEFYSSGDNVEYAALGRYSNFNYSNTVALHPSFT